LITKVQTAFYLQDIFIVRFRKNFKGNHKTFVVGPAVMYSATYITLIKESSFWSPLLQEMKHGLIKRHPKTKEHQWRRNSHQLSQKINSKPL